MNKVMSLFFNLLVLFFSQMTFGYTCMNLFLDGKSTSSANDPTYEKILEYVTEANKSDIEWVEEKRATPYFFVYEYYSTVGLNKNIRHRKDLLFYLNSHKKKLTARLYENYKLVATKNEYDFVKKYFTDEAYKIGLKINATKLDLDFLTIAVDSRLVYVDQRFDSHSNTLLILASYLGNIALAKLLLEKGANPNLVNGGGQTPLILAAATGNLEMLKLLIEFKAKPNIKDSFGNTALDYAVQYEHAEIARILKQYK